MGTSFVTRYAKLSDVPTEYLRAFIEAHWADWVPGADPPDLVNVERTFECLIKTLSPSGCVAWSPASGVLVELDFRGVRLD